MNGAKPKFMENLIITPSYYEQLDPYINAPSCHVNLLELSRYAKQCGKKLVEFAQSAWHVVNLFNAVNILEIPFGVKV